MKIYNTLTKQKEEFIPLEEKKVRMYACGPTVYNFFHIGNARCFTVFDMFRRYLEYRGYKVTFVQNFTDVDDKIIKRANEEGITSTEVASKYILEYEKDAKGLGIKPATIHPRATENIGSIIDIVTKLIENGHAYVSGNDVYFRTLSFKKYGCLSHMPIDDLEAGARIDVTEQKENPLDFALWKGAKPGEPSWSSPWGEGRPGWHIECSAMVLSLLGEEIDIHCGGQDLTFPHHENEIAQSECATGKCFARYWMHNGFINVDNTKMSKSLGNFFTVRDVADVYGYMPIRFFLLASHYRSPINYSKDIIEQSATAVARLKNCAENLDFYIANIGDGGASTDLSVFDSYTERFIAAMDDDFNTADAIGILFEAVREINSRINGENKPCKADAEAMKKFYLSLADDLLGLIPKDECDDVAEIEALIAERAAAKKEKNYKRADEIRALLLERSIILEDTPMGCKWRRA